MADDSTKLMQEVRSILSPDQEQLEELGDPAAVARHLEAAKDHLARAGAGLKLLYERRTVPPGIAGSDGVKAAELVGEVDKLAASVANYYA